MSSHLLRPVASRASLCALFALATCISSACYAPDQAEPVELDQAAGSASGALQGTDVRRTVVLIYGPTQSGQDMFLRGGIDHGVSQTLRGVSCTSSNFACAIPISHRNLRNATTSPWKGGDSFLDWYGRETAQTGWSHSIQAEGSAADWTTDVWPSSWGTQRTVAVDGYGVEPLNTFGQHYWMLDVDMDCSKAILDPRDGVTRWFELKTFISNGPGWESDVRQADAPYVSNNHFAKCGYVNKFERGSSAAQYAPLGPPPTMVEWPNAESKANSDPWIAQNHDRITRMSPKALALNFVNGRSNADMNGLFSTIMSGLSEGSRYHGYSDASATPFLSYSIAKSVNLTDAMPPASWPYINSTRYPRRSPSVGAYWRFDYGALFSQQYANYYAIPDPNNPSHNLTLCELLDRGIIHEVWVYGSGDRLTEASPEDVNAAEVLEYKPRYTEANTRIEGSFNPCAGNGCFDEADLPAVSACGRTVRINWVNNTRGPGCSLHSLGHGFEAMASTAIVPYLDNAFRHFANFDLQTRFATPFVSWYAMGSEPDGFTFTSSNSLTWRANGSSGSIAAYNQGCGSVHFAPNFRRHYDSVNDFGVLSTCEHYGLRDGVGGSDAQELYTRAKADRYESSYPDCEGGWQVYWRQSFPGFGNRARDTTGAAMKNWWPFLYY